MRRWVLAYAVGATAMGGMATAQEPPRPGGGMAVLLRADADGDGTVSRAEYQAEVDRRFARQDRNGDGRLDAGEGPGGRMMARGDAGPPPPTSPKPPTAPKPPVAGTTPPPPPPGLDAGQTRDQYRARAMQRFDGIDTNKDGRLDAAEVQAARSMPRGPAAPPSPAD